MIGILAAIAVGAFVTSLCLRFTESAAVRATCLITYAAHVALALAMFGIIGLYVPDATLYDGLAREVAQQLSQGLGPSLGFTDGKQGWVYALGFAYWAFGDLSQVGLVMNSVVCALTVLAVAYAAKWLGFDERTQRRSAILTAMAPPLVVWGSFLLRDAAAVFLIAVLFGAVARQVSGVRSHAWVVAIVSGVALYYVRGTALVLVIPALLLALGLRKRAAAIGGVSAVKTPRTTAAFRPFAMAVLMIAGVAVFQIGVARFGWSVDQANVSYDATVARGTLVTGGTTQIGSGIDPAVQAVLRLPNTVLGPFPWDWAPSSIGLLSAVDAVFWAFLLWFVLRGWRNPETRSVRLLCILPALVVLMTIALTTGAFGSIIRYRAMALPFIIPLAASGRGATAAVGDRSGRGTVAGAPAGEGHYRRQRAV